MQHSDHNGVRLFFDAPIVGSFELNGRTILTMCRRNLDDAIRDMRLLVEILPQNSITNQEVIHANRLVDVGSAVDPGVPVRVGAVQRGSEK